MNRYTALFAAFAASVLVASTARAQDGGPSVPSPTPAAPPQASPAPAVPPPSSSPGAPALGDSSSSSPPGSPSSSPDTPTDKGDTKKSTDEADRGIKLTNFHGLSGAQDLIDARVPEGVTLRGGLQLQQSHQDLHGHVLDFSQERIDLNAYAGIAALSLFEIGGQLPWTIDRTSKSFKSGETVHKDANTVGNLTLAGKVSLSLGWFSIAPFVQGTLPSGGKNVQDTSNVEFGGALAASLAKGMVVFHGNVSGQWISSGNNWAINWRLGVSVVPLASKVLLLRPYVYLDGQQRCIGDVGTDLSVAAGLQGLILDFIQVEAGAKYRFLASGGNGPDHDGPTNDVGTYSFMVGAGVAF